MSRGFGTSEQGVSQESLAELLDVSRQTVSKWETGQVRPSAANLARLSQALGVPVDALVKDDWVPPEEKSPMMTSLYLGQLDVWITA